MSPEEAKLFRLYGKLPNKKDLLQNKLKVRSMHRGITTGSLLILPSGAQVLRQRRLCPLQGRQGFRCRRHPSRPRAPQSREDPAHCPAHTRQRTGARQRRPESWQPIEGGQHLPAPRDKLEPRDVSFRVCRERRAREPAGCSGLRRSPHHRFARVHRSSYVGACKDRIQNFILIVLSYGLYRLQRMSASPAAYGRISPAFWYSLSSPGHRHPARRHCHVTQARWAHETLRFMCNTLGMERAGVEWGTDESR
jgi:hypothetical protein